MLNTAALCGGRAIIEYNLNIKGDPSRAMLIGSITHGAMEVLALYKLALQNRQKDFTHDAFGRFDVEQNLSDLPLEDILRVSYRFYDEESLGYLDDKSFAECSELFHKALVFQGGSFDPRNLDIVAAEYAFDYEVGEWGDYSYESPQGTINGRLRLRGTVDLISREDENTIVVCDYKTGKGMDDWATGKPKTFESLHYDQQLLLYYYVLSHLFPDMNIITILYFVRFDKCFTIPFERDMIPDMEVFLKKRFDELLSLDKPNWLVDTSDRWKCRFCSHSKNIQPGTNQTVCNFFRGQLGRNGFEKTMRTFGDYNAVNKYGDGGSSKDRE